MSRTSDLDNLLESVDILSKKSRLYIRDFGSYKTYDNEFVGDMRLFMNVSYYADRVRNGLAQKKWWQFWR